MEMVRLLFQKLSIVTSSRMTDRPIPEKIRCKLSGEVCKRGVRVGCCNTVASRYLCSFYQLNLHT